MFRSEGIGRLTNDPELRKVQIAGNEVSVCEFGVAFNFGFGDNEKTEFVNCVAWRGLADTIAKFFVKGRKIYVSGRQQTRSYENEKFKDVNGSPVKVYRTEWIIDDFEFCDSNANNKEGAAQPSSSRAKTNNTQFQGGATTTYAPTSEAPF